MNLILRLEYTTGIIQYVLASGVVCFAHCVCLRDRLVADGWQKGGHEQCSAVSRVKGLPHVVLQCSVRTISHRMGDRGSSVSILVNLTMD